MGPHEIAPLADAGGAPDHAARAAGFVRRHPHVTITASRAGWEATWIEAAPGRSDGEVRRERREILGHLVDYLEARFDRPHKAEPRPGTVYSVAGRNTGLEADLSYQTHYPVEAFCAGCELVIRLEHMIAIGPGGEWQHTGRKPGEPAG